MCRRFNLYEALDTKSPGRKTAKMNYGLQVGLSKTPLGNDCMRKILLSANTPPPARRSLQKASNKVLLSNRCHQLKEGNTFRGNESPHAISVQCDAMYNNPLYSGLGETPLQPATQTVYSFAGLAADSLYKDSPLKKSNATKLTFATYLIA